ncbi:MAG: 3-hydroxy-3-methylglutaryl-CoA reductase [Verrucomicrobia bacterium]|jgi:hydroxymethylglutaryl-CoA reductase (NADPH)|nr:3-hydroxy-3-methylglutaryl-CoA reductase [Verrucomicrobiota bacterium]
MAESIEKANAWLQGLENAYPQEDWQALLQPDRSTPCSAAKLDLARNAADVRRQLEARTSDTTIQQVLLPGENEASIEAYLANIENCIGTVQLPLGIAGPVRIRGSAARGDFPLPLATHEAALVASYHRGAIAISEAGGCTAVTLNEGVSRVPCFTFERIHQAASFLAWAVPQQDTFKKIAESTTTHGKLTEIKITVEGNHVFLHFYYHTGDAAGQNMVTVATQAVVDHILAHSPVQPYRAYVESNLSGDKKASAMSFSTVRGKKVTCEIVLPAAILKKRLGTSADEMEDYWRVSSIGGVLSGSLGIQGHYANGLAALFIACGQDAACVAEAAIGVTRFERRGDDLYAAVTLPNLIVGTVGGGTGLPTQSACLKLLCLRGTGHARAFAEVCAATALAGELSIIAALASGKFTRAHEVLARRRKRNHGSNDAK